MNYIKERLNKFQFYLAGGSNIQHELQITMTDSNQLILEGASSSIPERIMGMSIAILSLILPFHSDLFEHLDSTNVFDGYDFYNHKESIALRCMTLTPGLCVFLFYGKNTQCVLDKNKKVFSVIQKYDWKTLLSEGSLDEVSDVEICSIDNSEWTIFKSLIFTNILVRLLKHSGESVSFTFIVKRKDLDKTIHKTRDMLCEFLDLPI